MALEHILTHQADAKARLVHQFHDKPVIEHTAEAVGAQAQKVEDAEQALLVPAVFRIASAAGDQLDLVGNLIGAIPRPTGMDDADYRWFVVAQILINKSSGTPDEIIAVMEAVQNVWPGDSFSLDELGQEEGLEASASFRVRMSMLPTDRAQVFANILHRIRPIGVKSFFQSSPSDDDHIFTFAPVLYPVHVLVTADALAGATAVQVADPGHAMPATGVVQIVEVSYPPAQPPRIHEDQWQARKYTSIDDLGTDWLIHLAAPLARDVDTGDMVQFLAGPGAIPGQWVSWHKGFAAIAALASFMDVDRPAGSTVVTVEDPYSFPTSGVITIGAIGLDANEEDVPFSSSGAGSFNLATPTTKPHSAGDIVRVSSNDLTNDPAAGRLAGVVE